MGGDAKDFAALARPTELMSTALPTMLYCCSPLCSEPLYSMPLLTLFFIQNGGGEANPFMSFVLSHGQTPFMGVKMASTGLGAWFLVAHQYFPMAYRGLLVLAGGYMGVLSMHAFILLS